MTWNEDQFGDLFQGMFGGTGTTGSTFAFHTSWEPKEAPPSVQLAPEEACVLHTTRVAQLGGWKCRWRVGGPKGQEEKITFNRFEFYHQPTRRTVSGPRHSTAKQAYIAACKMLDDVLFPAST